MHVTHGPRAEIGALPFQTSVTGAEARTAGGLEIVEMLPQVGGVLDPLLHGERLVVRAHVARVEVVGQHGWPQYAPAPLGRDGDA
eukprot:scaffold129847_cov66-Phaeocystis_antarctica.AAC.6